MYGVAVFLTVLILFGYGSAHATTSAVNSGLITTTTDTTPPEPFDIALGGVQALFYGGQFLAFATSDADSGLDYYEVVEGERPPVRSNGSYVLHNQRTSELVAVLAYDKAGNVRTAVYTTEPTALRNVLLGVVASLLVGAGVYKVFARPTKKHA
jgi:hypothetical protein